MPKSETLSKNPSGSSERLPNYSRKIVAQIMPHTPRLFHAVRVSLAKRWIDAARILSAVPSIWEKSAWMSLAASKVPILEIEFHRILLELRPIPARSCLNIMQMAATPNWTFSKSGNAGNTLRWSLAVKNAWINGIDLRIFKEQTIVKAPTNLQGHTFPWHILHLCGLKVGESHPAKQIRVQVAATKRGRSFRLVWY